MPIYTVHVPRAAEGSVEAADRTAFLRDGFNGWAFLLGPLFLLRHRAWVAAAAWLVVVGGGAALAAALALPVATRVLLLLAVELFVGLEGNALRGHVLRRRGYDVADVVAGRNRDEGELTYFRARERDAADARPPAPARAPRRPSGGQPVIGSFPGEDG